jgi:CRP-like cAMP-binding protein
VTRETPLVPGELLFREGDPPALYVVIEGELSLEPAAGGEPRFAGPGDTVGVFETLIGAETTGWRAHVTKGGLALRVEREALFDLLADRIGLLQGVFTALDRRVSSERARVTPAPRTYDADPARGARGRASDAERIGSCPPG